METMAKLIDERLGVCTYFDEASGTLFQVDVVENHTVNRMSNGTWPDFDSAKSAWSQHEVIWQQWWLRSEV
jgi:hypothetical protein